MLDRIIWWTGASVLTAGAALGASGLLWLLSEGAREFAILSTRRLGNIATNLRDMHQWVAAGKPKWDMKNSPRQMRPTTDV